MADKSEQNDFLEGNVQNMDEIWSDLEESDFAEIYCVCLQPESGLMICCSASNCEIEWFHLGCMGFTETTVPDGDWTCDDCKEQKRSSTKGYSNCKTKTAKPKKKKGTTSSSTSIPASNESDKKKQKKKREMKTPTYGKEKAENDATDILKDSVSALVNGDASQLNAELKSDFVTLETSLQDHRSAWGSFAKNIVNRLWPAISPVAISYKSVKQEEMCTLFHALCIGGETDEQFSNTANSIGLSLTMETFIVQFLMEEVLKQILVRSHSQSQLLFTNDIASSTSSEAPALSQSEDQVLRYTAGYVARKLVRRYRRMADKESSKTLITTLEGWKVDDSVPEVETFLSYTRRLVDISNRGGLFTINDKVYNFFKETELVVNPVLKVKHAGNFPGTNLKLDLDEKLHNSIRVHNGWSQLIEGMDNKQLEDKLFNDVLSCWISLRIKAFVSAYMFVHQKNEKTSNSRKGEKGLRKTLKKKKSSV